MLVLNPISKLDLTINHAGPPSQLPCLPTCYPIATFDTHSLAAAARARLPSLCSSCLTLAVPSKPILGSGLSASRHQPLVVPLSRIGSQSHSSRIGSPAAALDVHAYVRHTNTRLTRPLPVSCLCSALLPDLIKLRCLVAGLTRSENASDALHNHRRARLSRTTKPWS